MFKKFSFIFAFYFLSISQNLFSKPLNFDGLSKFSMSDIQSITSIDIYDENLELKDINKILKELSLSDLIYEISYTEYDDLFTFNIIEADIVENIFINNNVWIKDDLIIQNLITKNNSFLTKNKIQDDIKIIKNVYKSKGFINISVIAKVEKYSSDRINLIYEIEENEQQRINIINFIGNNFFSNSYLNSIINSQSIKFYNILKSGSNLNFSTFEFDKNKIASAYRDEGFGQVKVSYVLEKTTLNNNVLYFYINEGQRTKIKNVDFNYNNIDTLENLLKDLSSEFNKELKNNNNYYSKSLIEKYIDLYNSILVSNNIHNLNIDSILYDDDQNLNLSFVAVKKDPIIVNKINISGNSITKNKTIRSKISIEPGQYFNNFLLDKSIKNLKRYPYIKDINVTTETEEQLVNINIDIDEETKTGNILLAGTYNADTGAGVTFGIEDKNIFGSGNSINTNFSVNSEDLKFSLNFKQYPVLNPDLTNTYTIFNQDNDYTDSFGYKASTRGLGYFVNFKQNEKLSYGAGLDYQAFKGHSAINTTSTSINDNIGNFDNYKINLSLNYDTTNNYFYPTNGYLNKINFTLSPEGISDNAFYKISVTNNNYFKLPKSDNYLFFNNKYGYAESLNSKLKTIDAFGLGGLNFKGFDYKGIGPYDGNVYLGGNEYFTSTVGYGSSFIFDEKDNINIKFFLTTGSIWNSDYTNASDIELRASIGTSLDFITPIGPLSFSYAVPFEKNNTDKTRSFNFTLGTSFWFDNELYKIKFFSL